MAEVKVINKNFFKGNTLVKNQSQLNAEIKNKDVDENAKTQATKKQNVTADVNAKPQSAQKQRVVVNANPQPTAAQKQNIKTVVREKAKDLKISPDVIGDVFNTYNVLMQTGFPALANEVKKIHQGLSQQFFSVAVVGEFSRGKSSFINKFIGRDILPVGILPTTALVTSIKNSNQEMIALYDKKGKKVSNLPIKDDSWNNLIVDVKGECQVEGKVFVGVNNQFLKINRLEIVDTPGAGDLDKKRSEIVSSVLTTSDAAIITISAISPLSETEHLFIEQRLISKKIPYLMLIITHMDQVPENERSKVFNFIKDKLSSWNIKIPVYIPYDIEIEDKNIHPYIGMDKIQQQLTKWVDDPNRERITEAWVKARLDNCLSQAKQIVEEKLVFANQKSEDARKKLIAEKRAQMQKVSALWQDCYEELRVRKLHCVQEIEDKLFELKEEFAEELIVEMKQRNDLNKWWNEVYPFRVKRKIIAICKGMDNAISKKLQADAIWLNSKLAKLFSNNKGISYEIIKSEQFDKNESKFLPDGDTVEIEDVNVNARKKQMLYGGLGLAVTLITSLPVMMIAGLASSYFVHKSAQEKILQQQYSLAEKIENDVEKILVDTTRDLTAKISTVYDNLWYEADKSEGEWYKLQNEALQSVDAKDDPSERNKLEDSLNSINSLLQNMN